MATPPVPQRYQKQVRFLACLARGKSPAEAAAMAGVPLPTFYTWRHKHTRFREAWKKAMLHAHTPPFPPPAELAALSLEGPPTHWFWVPGGQPEGAPKPLPGDPVVVVVCSFGPPEEPDSLIFHRVHESGKGWVRLGEGHSHEPLPEGFSHPSIPIPAPLAARLPPLRATAPAANDGAGPLPIRRREKASPSGRPACPSRRP